MISTAAICLMANAACGFSPLLNHTYPVRHPESVAIQSEDSLTCKMEFQSGSLCADFIWVKEPNGSDEGSMKVYFWEKNQPGTYADRGALQLGVKLWMPDMGHGSQKVKVEQVLKGVYDATEIMFVMGGVWEIQFQLKDGSGKVLEVQKVPYRAL